MEFLLRNFALFLPLLILQLGLQIISLVKLAKANSVRSMNKALWGVIIVFGSMLGAVIFLIIKPYEES